MPWRQRPTRHDQCASTGFINKVYPNFTQYLKVRSAAARLLGLWVRIPPEAWVSVSWDCCVLSGRGLCDELVPRPEESYRMWCV
jgi:hypothetical protein